VWRAVQSSQVAPQQKACRDETPGLIRSDNNPQNKNHMPNQVVWFDVPVTDLDRAIKFYSAVLKSAIKKEQYPGMTFAVLPHEDGEVSGCLTPGHPGQEAKPSSEGPLLYFNCQGRLDDAIAAVAPSGGKVVQPKHPIGPYGFRAIILDSDGNRIALHSM
jgi:predicted enzyme related to lactoylglutathione lyase